MVNTILPRSKQACCVWKSVHFGGFLIISIVQGAQNPILIIKAPTIPPNTGGARAFPEGSVATRTERLSSFSQGAVRHSLRVQVLSRLF